MTEFGELYSTVLAYITLTLVPITVILFALTVRFWKHKTAPFPLFGLISKYALHISFFISLSAVFGSLIYSQILGFPPCTLCWIHRILIYPQVLFFAIAIMRNERSILVYTLPLTVLGIFVGLFQYTQEMLQVSLVPCGINEVSCLIRYVYVFEFVTIPFMSLVLFCLLGVVGLIGRRFSS